MSKGFRVLVWSWLFSWSKCDVRGSVLNRGEAIEQDRCLSRAASDTNGQQRQALVTKIPE